MYGPEQGADRCEPALSAWLLRVRGFFPAADGRTDGDWMVLEGHAGDVGDEVRYGARHLRDYGRAELSV